MNKFFWLSLLLGLTFFGFIDDRFRGFDDTNQFFVEAREYTRGNRPPVKAITQDRHAGHDNPYYTTPLTAYSWSLLNHPSDYRRTLWNVKLYQALLMFFSFMVFIWCLGGRKFTFDAFIIGVLVFMNELSRSLVFSPLSEGAALALLVASYAWPSFSGVGTALQFVTRYPMIVLQGMLLWRNKKNPKVIISAVVVGLIMVFLFRELIRPSHFIDWHPSFGKTWGNYYSIFWDWSYQYFNHLLPYDDYWFHVIWGTIVTAWFLAVIYYKRREWLVWALCFTYAALVLLFPYGAGVRYVVPIAIFLILEFKPTLPKRKWARWIFIIMALHLIHQQVQGVFEFKRYPIPETDTPALAQTKQWLHDQGLGNSRIMMIGWRFCVHYFDTECFSIADGDIAETIKNEKIDFVLLTGLAWHKPEVAFIERFWQMLKAKKYPLEKHVKRFEGLTLVDVRDL